MNIAELIAAYSKLKKYERLAVEPEIRKYMAEELPKKIKLPETAHVEMQDNSKRAKEISDLIGAYTGVHPSSVIKKQHELEFSDKDVAHYVHENYGFDFDKLTPSTQQSYREEFAMSPYHLENKAFKDAVQSYGDTGYRQINKVFRDPFGEAMDPYITDQARVLMDAFKPIENDLVLYRGLAPGRTYEKLAAMDRRGELEQYGNKSFMSTSLSPKVARRFADTGQPANNFRILVPKGTPVLPVHGYGSSNMFTPELEYVLPPDSRFDILPKTAANRYQLADADAKYTSEAAKPHMGQTFDSVEQLQQYLKDYVPDWEHYNFKTRTLGNNDYTDLIMSKAGAMKEPGHVPDQPGVGWLAGMLPLGGLGGTGLIDKYAYQPEDQ